MPANETVSVEVSVGTLDQARVRVRAVASRKGVQCRECVPVRVDFEDRSVTGAASFGRSVEASIPALDQTRVGVRAVAAGEAVQFGECCAIRVDLEDGPVGVGRATLICRSIQVPIGALNQGRMGIRAVRTTERFQNLVGLRLRGCGEETARDNRQNCQASEHTRRCRAPAGEGNSRREGRVRRHWI
jgi:hypothetical protein